MEHLFYYIPTNLFLFKCGISIHCSKYFLHRFVFCCSKNVPEITEPLHIISKSIEFELFDMKLTTLKVDETSNDEVQFR